MEWSKNGSNGETDDEIQILKEIENPKESGMIVPYKFSLNGTTSTIKEMKETEEPRRNGFYKPAITFGDDTGAMSSDPEAINRNYRIPWNRLNIQNGKFNIHDDGMLIVSPEFASTHLGVTFTNWFKEHSVNKHLNGTSTTEFGFSYKPKEKSVEAREQDKISVDSQSETSENGLGISIKSEQEADAPELPKTNENKRVSPRIVETDLDNLIVSEYRDVGAAVNLSSIKRLSVNSPLNDDLIDFGVYYFIQGLASVVYVRAFAWTLYIGRTQVKDTHMDTLFKMFTKKGADMNLLHKKFVIIPVNRDNHWFLSIICSPFPNPTDVKNATELISMGRDAKQISAQLYRKWTSDRENPPMVFILDSMYENMRHRYSFAGFHASTAKHLITGLKHIHQRLWRSQSNGIIAPDSVFESDSNDVGTHIRHHSLRVPPQCEGNDCGLFSIKNTQYWFESMKETSQNYTSMVNKDCTKWYDPSQRSMRLLRKWTYLKIMENCKSQRPTSFQHLLDADPCGLITPKFDYTQDSWI